MFVCPDVVPDRLRSVHRVLTTPPTMQYTVFSVVLLAALTAGASLSSPSESSTKQKRGLFGSYYSPATVVAHEPVVAPAPVYHAPVVASAPVYHAPLVAHAPASTSYSSISITHSAPKVIAHAPVAPVYHAPVVAHAPVYHAPVYEHAPLVAHAPAYSYYH